MHRHQRGFILLENHTDWRWNILKHDLDKYKNNNNKANIRKQFSMRFFFIAYCAIYFFFCYNSLSFSLSSSENVKWFVRVHQSNIKIGKKMFIRSLARTFSPMSKLLTNETHHLCSLSRVKKSQNIRYSMCIKTFSYFLLC